MGTHFDVELPQNSSRSHATAVTVTRTSYHGWSDCWLISNGMVEAVAIPSIGRIMQFRHVGDPEGAFWENRALDGQLHPEVSKEWVNFGGDKCWPAPQSAWPSIQGHAWPPPAAFDASSLQAVVTNGGLTLASPLDPDFGIGFVRRVELQPRAPVMRVRTEFHKIAGNPVRVAVWTVTQMRDPLCIFVMLPEITKFANGYVSLSKSEPKELHRNGRVLSFARDARADVKIGTEGKSLLWVGNEEAVRIDTERAPGNYPDGGCVTEVYTSPDPLDYVELETLGPLAEMKVGDRMDMTTVYTLLRRSANDAEGEAVKAFRADH